MHTSSQVHKQGRSEITPQTRVRTICKCDHLAWQHCHSKAQDLTGSVFRRMPGQQLAMASAKAKQDGSKRRMDGTKMRRVFSSPDNMWEICRVKISPVRPEARTAGSARVHLDMHPGVPKTNNTTD